MAGGASAAYSLGAAGPSGAAGVASGLGGVARAGFGATTSPLRRAVGRAADSLKSSFAKGAQSVAGETGDSSAMSSGGEAGEVTGKSSGTAGTPAWAKRMKRTQQMTHGVQTAAHAVRSGDGHGGGSSVNLSEGDR